MGSRIARATLLLILTAACADSPEPHSQATEQNGSIPIGADRLAYTELGDGSPVVLLGRGSGMDRRQWTSTRSELADEFRVLAIDPRGIGETMPERLAGFNAAAQAGR